MKRFGETALATLQAEYRDSLIRVWQLASEFEQLFNDSITPGQVNNYFRAMSEEFEKIERLWKRLEECAEEAPVLVAGRQ